MILLQLIFFISVPLEETLTCYMSQTLILQTEGKKKVKSSRLNSYIIYHVLSVGVGSSDAVSGVRGKCNVNSKLCMPEIKI